MQTINFRYLLGKRPYAIFHILHFCVLNPRPRAQFAKLNINTSINSLTSQWFIAIGREAAFRDSGVSQDSARFSVASVIRICSCWRGNVVRL